MEGSPSEELRPQETPAETPSISPAELTELLTRLEASRDQSRLIQADPTEESEAEASSHATLEAIAEATGRPVEEIAATLEEIRLSERLRELEAPLYRVERPGFTVDPLGPGSYLTRQRLLTNLKERLPQRPAAKRAPTEEELRADRASHRMGLIILGMTIALMALLILQYVVRSL